MNRKTANLLRYFLDDWLPPVIRECAIFDWLFKLWLGPESRSDFKKIAFRLSGEGYAALYQSVGGGYMKREADTTERQREWLVRSIRGRKVLEIGPGKGELTDQLIREGYEISTEELFSSSTVHSVPPENRHVGTVEKFQFPDKSFDTVIIAMVLEHVRNLTSAILELERVARQRVLIVTPRQRYYRITFDYHLHFFYSLDHLASHIPRGKTEGEVIDGDLCLKWDVNDKSTRTSL